MVHPGRVLGGVLGGVPGPDFPTRFASRSGYRVALGLIRKVVGITSSFLMRAQSSQTVG